MFVIRVHKALIVQHTVKSGVLQMGVMMAITAIAMVLVEKRYVIDPVDVVLLHKALIVQHTVNIGVLQMGVTMAIITIAATVLVVQFWLGIYSDNYYIIQQIPPSLLFNKLLFNNRYILIVVKGYVQNHPLIVIRVQKAVNVQYTIEAGVD